MAVKFTGKFTIWKMNDSDKIIDEHTTKGGKSYIEVMCSSASKDKETGKYKTDFSGKLRFWGQQAEKFKSLDIQAKDMIDVKEGTHTNNWDKEKGMMFSNYVVWDFDPIEKKENLPKQPDVIEPAEPFDPLTDNSLPF